MCLSLCALLATGAGCSLRTYAINTVGDALASGNSAYESDSDIELVGAALPFGLKLTESLLAESPRHGGLLLTACRGFTMYSYAFIASDAERLTDEDLDRARAACTSAPQSTGSARWSSGIGDSSRPSPRTLAKR
jgi:hypothetical protein